MIFNFQCEVELITPILQRKKSGLQKCPLNCPKLHSYNPNADPQLNIGFLVPNVVFFLPYHSHSRTVLQIKLIFVKRNW